MRIHVILMLFSLYIDKPHYAKNQSKSCSFSLCWSGRSVVLQVRKLLTRFRPKMLTFSSVNKLARLVDEAVKGFEKENQQLFNTHILDKIGCCKC